MIPHFPVGLALCLILVAGTLSAREKPRSEDYRASTTPEALAKNARAVVRYSNSAFTVQNEWKAVWRVHTVVTILNAEGRDFGELYLWYDKFRKVDDLTGRLFDADGKEIRSLGRSDVADYSGTGGSLYEDNRIKHAALYHSVYPYTVEFEYEYKFNGYLAWPDWFPEREYASAEYARYAVTLPAHMALRYIQTLSVEPSVSEKGNQRTYVWEAGALPVFETEPVGPGVRDQKQYVKIAPTQFEIDGHRGNLSSWESFGKWYLELSGNRQSLPGPLQQEVLSLVAGTVDPREQVRVLYEYMQSKTRYVSVQLGIGGWQPFDAKYVYERGYGDCKALTNYMLSLLMAADISAHPALIHSSPLPPRIEPEFSHSNFNHVILCVPLEKDTVWLECTSQTMPFGHIGVGNENRTALLVTPEGGRLVRTPASRAEENLQLNLATVTLSGLGTASVNVRTTSTGIQQDRVRHALATASPRDREEWLRETLDIPSFNLKGADYSGIDKKERSVSLSVDLEIPRYASIAGSRLLFQPNLLQKRTYVPKSIENRQHPVVHSYPYLNIDSVVFRVPTGFKVEALPKPVTLETPFARFHSGIEPGDENTLLFTRHVEFFVTEIPPDQYADYIKFWRDIVQADKATAALVKR